MIVQRNIRLYDEDEILIVRKDTGDVFSDPARHRCGQYKYSVNLLCAVADRPLVGRNIYGLKWLLPLIRPELSPN